MKISVGELIKAVGLNGGSAFFTQGATLLLTLILSNMLGPEGLAQFFVTQNTANTMALILQMGLAYTAMTFAARYHAHDAPYAKAIIVFCQNAVMTVASIASAIVAVGSGWIAINFYGSDKLATFVFLASIAAPFTAIALVQLNVLNGLGLYRSIFASSVVSAMLMLSGAVAGAMAWGPQGAAAGFTFSTVTRAAILQWRIWHHQNKIEKKELPPRDIWLRIRNFAIPTGLAGLTLTPATWLSNAMLLNHGGLQELGLFLGAMTVRTAVFFVPQQIGSTFLPRYIKQSQISPQSAVRNFWLMTAVMLGVSIGLVLFSVVAGSYILALFGKDFSQAEVTLRVLMLTVIFETASLAFSTRLAADERMWTMLLAYTWPKDLLLLLVAFLAIPQWNGLGLAFAYLASVIYGFIAYMTIFKPHRSFFGLDTRQEQNDNDHV